MGEQVAHARGLDAAIGRHRRDPSASGGLAETQQREVGVPTGAAMTVGTGSASDRRATAVRPAERASGRRAPAMAVLPCREDGLLQRIQRVARILPLWTVKVASYRMLVA